MIHEVDHALRLLIEREALAGTDVEVVFDAPTKDWAARRTVPTVDVYLYDIREDMRRRERGMINTYEGDKVASRHLPPRHFKLSYLVTAWTQRPEDEHRLLATLLSCFLQYEAVPPELVTGPLAETGMPVPLSIALPPPEDRSFADVWSALGGELKPSLDIVVSAPTRSGVVYPAAPPITAPATISLGGLGAWPPRETTEGRPAPKPRAGAGAGSATGTDGASLPHDGDAAGAAGGGSAGGKSAGTAGRGGSRTAGKAGSRSGGRGGAAAAGSASEDGDGDGADSAGAEGRSSASGSASPSRGLDWHELAGLPSPTDERSAEGAPPRRRGRGVQQKGSDGKGSAGGKSSGGKDSGS